jgi:hypothetical protein
MYKEDLFFGDPIHRAKAINKMAIELTSESIIAMKKALPSLKLKNVEIQILRNAILPQMKSKLKLFLFDEKKYTLKDFL